MLVRNGFQDCRVHTPESQRLASLSQGTTTTSSTPPPPHPESSNTHPSHPVSATMAGSTSATSNLTLRTKASLVSFGGLVSSFWGVNTSTNIPSDQPESYPTPTKDSDTNDGMSAIRTELINRWVQEAAASTAVSRPSQPPSSTQARPDIRDDRIAILSDPSPAIQTRLNDNFSIDGMDENSSHASSSQSTSYTNTSTCIPCELNTGDTLQSQGVRELSAESLLRGTLRHALSDPSMRSLVRIQAPVQFRHPSLSSIFSKIIPSIPTPAPEAIAHSSTALPISSAEGRPTAAEPVRATPSAHPEPKLLRKTASQHTLRLAASPVLSTQEAAARPQIPSLPIISATPQKPRTPPVPSLPQNNSKPEKSDIPAVVSVSTPPANKGKVVPRQIAHRHPRDSPVGETRVVRSSTPGVPHVHPTVDNDETPSKGIKKPTTASKHSPKTTSILDHADEDDGLWSPPRSRSSAVPSRNRDALPANTAPTRPKLRAKESLEYILAIGERQRSQQTQPAKQKQQQVQQQTDPGRKVLGQLSTFHRNALPPAKKTNNTTTKSSSNSTHSNSLKSSSPAPLKPLAAASKVIPLSGPKDENSGITGTLKGFFNAAAAWVPVQQPLSKPKPSTSATRPKGNPPPSSSSSSRQTDNSRLYKSKSTGGDRHGYQRLSRTLVVPTIIVSDASNDENQNIRVA